MSKRIVPLLLLAFTFIGCGNEFTPSAVSAAGPQIVRKSFINQVGPIQATPVFHVPADGDYRLSIYVSMAKPAAFNAGIIAINPSWTDENTTTPLGANLVNPFAIQIQPLDLPIQIERTMTIHAKSGTDIKIDGDNASDHSNKYDCFVVVEALQ